MSLETALYPDQLNAANPPQSDFVREGAGHLRLIKTVIKTTFPNVTGAITASHTQLNYMVGVTSSVQAQIDSKGAIAGQTWTGPHIFSGTVTLPANTTIGSVSPTEITYLDGVTSPLQAQLDAKPNLSGGTYTGPHNFSGASSVTLPINTTLGSLSPAELGYVDGVTAPIQGQLDGKADITGESYSGTHDFSVATIKVPTLPTGTNTTDAASTAFVNSTALSSALPGQTGNAGKFVTTDGTTASWAFADLIDVNVTATSHNAVAGTRVRLRNAALTTVTLPPSPNDGDIIGWMIENGLETNVIARNGKSINGFAEDMKIDNIYFNGRLKYSAATNNWRIIT